MTTVGLNSEVAEYDIAHGGAILDIDTKPFVGITDRTIRKKHMADICFGFCPDHKGRRRRRKHAVGHRNVLDWIRGSIPSRNCLKHDRVIGRHNYRIRDRYILGRTDVYAIRIYALFKVGIDVHATDEHAITVVNPHCPQWRINDRYTA